MSEKLTFKQARNAISDEISERFSLPTRESTMANDAKCDQLFEKSKAICENRSFEECAQDLVSSSAFIEAEDCYMEMAKDFAIADVIESLSNDSLIGKLSVPLSCLSSDEACITEEIFKEASQYAISLADILFLSGDIDYQSLLGEYPSGINVFGTDDGIAIGRPTDWADALWRALTASAIADITADRLEDLKIIDEIALLGGVESSSMDSNGDGKIGVIDAIAFALSDIEWERYAPAFDAYGISHPLDSRHYPPEILDRIECIAAKVESDIGIGREEDGFCEAFIPAFIEEGEKSFADGGLCFGYTEAPTISFNLEPEMTSAEAFAVCMDPDHTFGSCTEMTFMIMGALEATGVPCHMSSMNTENHAYPAYRGVSLDPIGIGEIGWSDESNPASTYYFNRAAKEEDDLIYSVLASLIDPDIYYNAHSVDEVTNKIIRAGTYDDGRHAELFEELLKEFDSVVASNPKRILPFNELGNIITALPNGAGLELAISILKRWPDSPYAIRPIMVALASHPDHLKSKQGDMEAAKRYELKLSEVALRLDDEFPNSGFSETLRASYLMSFGNMELAKVRLDMALSLNPNNATALSMMASLLLVKGRFDESKAYAEKSIEIAPNHEGNHSTLAIVAQLRGEIDLASVEARKEATVYYNNPVATLLAASLANARYKPHEGLELISDMPKPDEVVQAHSYMLMGKYRQALKAINSAMEAASNTGPLHQIAAFIHLHMWNTEEARKASSGIDDAAMKAVIDFNIATSEGDLESAQKILSSSESIQGLDPIITEGLEPTLLCMVGDLEGARDIYEDLATKRSHEIGYKVAINYIDVELGHLEKVRKSLEGLMADYPKIAILKEQEAILLLREGEYKKALAVSNEILKAAPLNFNALIVKGFSLMELGMTKRPLKIGKKLVRRFPKLPAGYMLMARAHLARGKISKAQEFLQKARDIAHYDAKTWPRMSFSALAKDIEAAKAKKKSD